MIAEIRYAEGKRVLVEFPEGAIPEGAILATLGFEFAGEQRPPSQLPEEHRRAAVLRACEYLARRGLVVHEVPVVIDLDAVLGHIGV